MRAEAPYLGQEIEERLERERTRNRKPYITIQREPKEELEEPLRKEDDNKFFSQKYLESDLIRLDDEYEDYPSGPRVEFRFKFNSDTGVFSANTDLQLKVTKSQGINDPGGRTTQLRASSPPLRPQEEGFRIYTLPT